MKTNYSLFFLRHLVGFTACYAGVVLVGYLARGEAVFAGQDFWGATEAYFLVTIGYSCVSTILKYLSDRRKR